MSKERFDALKSDREFAGEMFALGTHPAEESTVAYAAAGLVHPERRRGVPKSYSWRSGLSWFDRPRP